MVSKIVGRKRDPRLEAELHELKSSPYAYGFSSTTEPRQRQGYRRDSNIDRDPTPDEKLEEKSQEKSEEKLEKKSEEKLEEGSDEESGETPESILCSSAETLIEEHQDAVRQSENAMYSFKPSAVSNMAFYDMLDQECGKLKQRSFESIDKAYSIVLETINSLSTPSEQEKALSFWRKFSKKFSEFWDKAMDAFQNVIRHVQDCLSDIWQKVEECWSQIRCCMQKVFIWLAKQIF